MALGEFSTHTLLQIMQKKLKTDRQTEINQEGRSLDESNKRMVKSIQTKNTVNKIQVEPMMQ